jgi:16S rRNA (cytosine1402-N4)-methyltransferase
MHQPVLLKETINYLEPKPNDRFIDATFGWGGHSFELLKQIEPSGKILALEWDPNIVKIMETRLAQLAKQEELSMKNLNKKIILKNKNFKYIKKIARDEGFTSVKGVIFDLGVSVWHFKNSERGFGFSRNEPLDMRINPQDVKITAF